MRDKLKTQRVRTSCKDINLVRKQRAHIVKCAKKIFYEKGYMGTSTRELANACGMAQGSIYTYIGSKEDILHLITKNSGDRAIVLDRFLNKVSKSATQTEVLETCIKKYFQMVEEDSDELLFMNREIQNFSKGDREYLLKQQISMAKLFEKIVIKGIQTGEFKTQDPTLIGHNILMFGHDWALRRWFLKNRYTLEEYTTNQTALTLRWLQ